MKSIKSKILFVVIAGLLVITAVVSTIAVNMTHEIMHKDADRILNNVAQKEAAYINDALGDIEKSAAIMEHYAIAEIQSLAQLEDSEFLAKYIEKNKKMFAEIALNTNGVEGYYMRINPEYANSTTGFYNVISENSEIREMKITDLSKYPENDTKNVGWYYIPVSKGEALWLEPYKFPGYDTDMITYAIPVYVESQLLGVIGFDMDFGYLVEQINNISVYEKGYAVLLAADGEKSYNNTNKENSENPHTKATIALENGMFLELRADYKDIQSEIHPMLSRIVLAFTVVLVMAIIYTVIVTNRIVRPLNRLTAEAKKISSGIDDEQVTKVSEDAKDEVEVLSAVLKSTYEKIQEYTAYINALAYRDALTGIKNNTAYTECVAELDKEINIGNPQFAVLVADINNLKETNDAYGHDVGNDLISYTAKLLTDTFKTSGVFRIGGDEFAVILRGNDYNDYRTLLSRFDEAGAQAYITVLDTKIPVSIARGIAVYNSEIDRVYEDVFVKADKAMYLDKEKTKAALV